MLLFGIFVPEETAAAVSKPGLGRSISGLSKALSCFWFPE